MRRAGCVVGLFVTASAGGGDGGGNHPWEMTPDAGASSEVGGAGPGGHGTNSNGESEEGPGATSDPTVGVECFDETDCPLGSLCVEGQCVGGEDSSTTGGNCLPAMEPCAAESECCGDLLCDTTSLGQVCCGW